MTTERLLNGAYGLTESLLKSLLRAFFSGTSKRTGRDSLFTLPNVISLFRIPLGILVWICADSPDWRLPALLFAAAAISDHLDGTIARLMGPTHWGAMIDPTCDKVFFFLCAAAYRNRFAPWAFWTIIAVEAFILIAPYTLILTKRIDADTSDFRSNIYGKMKFTLECAALMMVIVWPGRTASYILFAAAGFGLWSIHRKIKDSVWAAKH